MVDLLFSPKALERFQVIRPYLEDGVSLVKLAQHHKLPLRTLHRWVKNYREKGVAGLARKPRSDKQISRRCAKPLYELVEALALTTPVRSVAAIHRMVCAVAKDNQEPPPSYSTVYTIVKAIAPALRTLAHEGSNNYSERYDLLYRREAKSPNALWQADHTLLDIWVLDDKGQPARPWLSVIMDDYSRIVCGYFLSLQAPSALQTALALRQAIWRKGESDWPVCGIPQILYTDHGSDFTSKHIEQVCVDLKIQLIFSAVGKPRGRGRIERFFETINQCLLCTLPGYSPAGYPDQKPVLRLDTLEQAFRTFILKHYHQTPHSATGITPLERWQENSFLPHLPESLEQLDLLLLTVAKPRQIQQDGIRFLSLRYIDPVLAAYVGETVTIRYDPRDMVEIRVFYRNRFLCRAVCQELAGETVSLKEIIQARRQRQRDLRQIIEQGRSVVDQWLRPPTTENYPVMAPLSSQITEPTSTVKKRLKRYASD